MKKLYLILAVIAMSISIFPQCVTIYLHDGSQVSYLLSTVDSLGFCSPVQCGTTTVSYSGQTYHTVLIGSQCWLKENLNVGVMINSLNGSTIINQTNNGTIEKYCYAENAANCVTYGGLYQWDEAMQYSTTPGTQGICPTGWHIPTTIENNTLAATVGNSANALKAIGQGSGGGAGTNTSGFSALLTGGRANDGTFNSLGSSAYFWSSTNGVNADFLSLTSFDNNISIFPGGKQSGMSIRCLKN